MSVPKPDVVPAPREAQDELSYLRDCVDDLTRELDAERAARAHAEDLSRDFEDVLQSMPQIVWITRPDGWHTYFNQQWLDFTGLTLEESLGHGWNPPFHPDDRARAAARWEQATSSGEPYEIEYRLRRADGVYHWMLGRAMPLRDSTGTIVKWFGTCTDIEDLKQAEVRIAEQARLLDLAQDAIFVEDIDRRVMYWNKGAERVFGWTSDDAIGHRLEELIAPDQSKIDSAVMAARDTGEWSGELHFVHSSGDARVVESRWNLVRDEDGLAQGVLVVNTDVTQRRALEASFIQTLEHEATHDALTGLPNRTLLAQRLQEAVEAAATQGNALSVLFVDLDGFKDVNDGAGHLLGDKVLAEVAIRLESAMRDSDTVARFGGDEFVVVLPGIDAVAADDIAERLLDAIRAPMELDGYRLHVSASIGIATAPTAHAQALLRAADAAVYHAKGQGRAQVRAFHGGLSEQAEERLKISTELADALANDALELVYQPIISVADGRVGGVEALARWPHPVRGPVAPDIFVTIAEKTGLAQRLDQWVLRRACAEFATLRATSAVPDTAYLAVNVTAASVADPAFPARIVEAIAASGLPSQALVVEVTETSVMTDIAAGAVNLARLRSLGIGVALDDFGTGWSSLAYLKRLPANILKLDRAFVGRLDQDEEDLAIASSVVALGKATGMTVVAEGVETPAQLDLLRSLECGAAQGYLWHRPVAPAALAQALVQADEGATRDVVSVPPSLPFGGA